MSVEEFKHILRIAGKDIEGSRKSVVALSEVKGIGYNLSQVILQSLNINPYLRVGFLTDKELLDIENAIKNISTVGVPKWYLNRQKDMDSGADIHLITSDLDFTQSNDIEREKSVMSWRGYRHMFGLRVRGQCTRTTGRKATAVGVKKAAGKAPAGAAGSK
ncbi:MAG TPA: 30S ribosomal protein S13 [Candidatus Saccharimonadales bacterium]|nr:30S ribosomal protein S13 [Thermoproteota archaeon]HYG00613.1 30S ribosomal protein S13 [Candidatus Saccharimonadales bacterium]